MSGVGSLEARSVVEPEGQPLSFARIWASGRIFFSSLRIVWVCCASLLAGAVMLVLATQGQDLFLDVRGGYLAGTAFWAAFYALFILFWVAPVYISSRWILSHVDTPIARTEEEIALAHAYEAAIPRALVAGCFGLLLIAQVGAIANAPFVLDAEHTVKDPKIEIKFVLAFLLALFGIVTFTRRLFKKPASLGDARSWQSNANALLLTLGLLLAPLVFFGSFETTTIAESTPHPLSDEFQILMLSIVVIVVALIGGNVLAALPWRWTRIVSALLLAPIGVLVLMPLVLGAAFLLVLYFQQRLVMLAGFELNAPLGIGHLAILPIVTFVLGYAAWFALAPGSRTRALLADLAARVERLEVAGRRVSGLDLVFAILLATTAAIILTQFLYHPVEITAHIYRALLVPFLLGLLVPVATFISYWSFRWHAPIFLTAIAILAFAAPDTADVRTAERKESRQTLEQAIAQWEKANACDRKSDDATLKCPPPIIVSVAGGASRSAFLLGAVMGRLLDETKTKSGEPLRPFENQLFAISGVSGGSLGATVTYAALADSLGKGPAGARTLGPPPCQPRRHDTEWFAPHIVEQPRPEQSWRECLQLILAGDFLSPVMASLVSNDIFGLMPRGDRAVILENAWERRYAHFTGQDPETTTLTQPLTSVRARAFAASDTAWMPMLVLGGTSVSTGRRILTSDIDTLLSAKLNNLRGRLFRDAYDLHELLGAQKSGVEIASFSPDGEQFLVRYYSNDNSPAEIWDTKTGTVVRQLDILPFAFWTSDGMHIISWGHADGGLETRVTRASTGETVHTLTGTGYYASLNTRGDLMVTHTTDTITTWEVATGRKLAEIAAKELYASPTFSHDGESLASVQEGRVFRVHNARTGALDMEVAAKEYHGDVRLSRDRRIAYGKSASEAGMTPIALDLSSGKMLFNPQFLSRVVAFSPGGSFLVYAPMNGTLRIRDIAAETEIELPGTASNAWGTPVFSPDGSRLVYAPARGPLRLRHLATGNEIELSGTDETAEPIFSPNGRRIMYWAQHGATVFDAETGRELVTIRGQEGRVKYGFFHPSGHLAITMSDNGLDRLWDLDTGEELYVIRATQSGEVCPHCDVRLSTAATMSARFPVISPHGNIRDRGRLIDRVVDGGYYENFGALTAVELTEELRNQFGLDPRIILINNEPAAAGMSCLRRDSQIELPNPPPRITFATLRSPIAALYAAGTARGTHAAVDLCARIGGGGKFAFITVIPDTLNEKAALPMSWWLSKHVQQYLDHQVDTENSQINGEAFRNIEEWRKLH